MDQKVVLFIGVCDHIGVSSIIEFAKVGHRIAVASQDIRTVQHALDMRENELLINNTSNYFMKTANFKDIEYAEELIKETVARFGRIDKLVINSSHLGGESKLHDGEFFDDFRDVLQMNLMFATRIMQFAEPYLIQSKGNIVIVSVVDSPNLSLRVAQAGLLMLNKTLANSFKHKEVRVNAIVDSLGGESCSQIVHKDLKGLGGIDFIDGLVDFIVLLGSDRASYVNGSIFKISKYQHIRPQS